MSASVLSKFLLHCTAGRCYRCLGRRRTVCPLALELPRCVQVIAYEEAQLIMQLRSLLPQDAAISSDVTMLTRNELLHEAQRLLPSDAWADFCLLCRLAHAAAPG